MIFDSEFIINFDGSLEDLWLLGEQDNPITVATLSSLRETKERNEKHNLRSFEKADKDDVEKYLYSDQDKFFVKLVLIKKNTDFFANDSVQKGDLVLFYRGTRLTRAKYFIKLIEFKFANEYIVTDEKKRCT